MFEKKIWSDSLKQKAEAIIAEIRHWHPTLVNDLETLIDEAIKEGIQRLKDDPTEICDKCERIDPENPPEPRYNEGMN